MKRAGAEAGALLGGALALLLAGRPGGGPAAALTLAAAGAEGLGLLEAPPAPQGGSVALRFRRPGLSGLAAGLVLVPWVLAARGGGDPAAASRASGASLLGLVLALASSPRALARSVAAACTLGLLGLGGLHTFAASACEAGLVLVALVAAARLAAPGSFTAGEAWVLAQGAASFAPPLVAAVLSPASDGGEEWSSVPTDPLAADALRAAALVRGLLASAFVLLPAFFALGWCASSSGRGPRTALACAAAALLLSGAAALLLADRLATFPAPSSALAQLSDLGVLGPFLWLLSLLAEHAWLLLFWVAALGAGLTGQALLSRHFGAGLGGSIFLRKNFHLLAALLFLPAHFAAPALLSVALAGALLLFVAGECLRLAEPAGFAGAALNGLFAAYLDERDARGRLCISHLSLLLGMSVPVWLENGLAQSGEGAGGGGHPHLAACAGYVALGAVDVAGVFVGKPWGRRKLFQDCPKSVEGTSAAALAAAAVLFGLQKSCLCRAGPVRLACAALAGATFEAVTDQMDNIFVPLQLYCVLKMVC